jgi:hypothetical protein
LVSWTETLLAGRQGIAPAERAQQCDADGVPVGSSRHTYCRW